MTTNILSSNWEGFTAAPINPETLRIKAVEAPVFGECDGCVFIDQRSDVCRRASAIAVDAGHPDCDQVLPGRRSVVYVIDKTDPRQLPLLEKGH